MQHIALSLAILVLAGSALAQTPPAATDSTQPPYATGGSNLFSELGRLQPGHIIGDPMLAPLAPNGGPTLTHALLPGSPAIDGGNNIDGFETDQRGRARTSGDAPDMGAYELQVDAIFASGFD